MDRDYYRGPFLLIYEIDIFQLPMNRLERADIYKYKGASECLNI